MRWIGLGTKNSFWHFSISKLTNPVKHVAILRWSLHLERISCLTGMWKYWIHYFVFILTVLFPFSSFYGTTIMNDGETGRICHSYRCHLYNKQTNKQTRHVILVMKTLYIELWYNVPKHSQDFFQDCMYEIVGELMIFSTFKFWHNILPSLVLVFYWFIVF